MISSYNTSLGIWHLCILHYNERSKYTFFLFILFIISVRFRNFFFRLNVFTYLFIHKFLVLTKILDDTKRVDR